MNADPTGNSYERVSTPGTYSPVIEGIKAGAEATVEELAHLTDFEFGYNRDSVAWLEGYIERMKTAGAFRGPACDKLISVFGAFLGECLARNFGGRWKQRNGAWGIAFNDEQIALPFAAVAAQVEQGRGAGIRNFFEMTPITFVGCIQPALQPQDSTRTFRRTAG